MKKALILGLFIPAVIVTIGCMWMVLSTPLTLSPADQASNALVIRYILGMFASAGTLFALIFVLAKDRTYAIGSAIMAAVSLFLLIALT